MTTALMIIAGLIFIGLISRPPSDQRRAEKKADHEKDTSG